MKIVHTNQGPAFQDDDGLVILLNGPEPLVPIVKANPEMIPEYVALLAAEVVKALDAAQTGLKSTPLGEVNEAQLAEVYSAIRALSLIGYSVEARIIVNRTELEHTHD